MSNLKFTLFVRTPAGFSVSLQARVFDVDSLEFVLRAIKSGVFGHHSKKKYFLVPLGTEEGPYMTRAPGSLQVFPKGGSLVNPLILGHFYFTTFKI